MEASAGVDFDRVEQSTNWEGARVAAGGVASDDLAPRSTNFQL